LDNHEKLRLIRDAHGDPAFLALATVDFTFPDEPDNERTVLRSALEAAAIPHWCDAAILADLTGSGSPSNKQWARLKKVPVVEPFPARGTDAGNVHEASRLAIRKHLTETQHERFMQFSSRAVRLFEADTRPISRIESTYHLLVADPERGAVALENLDRTWSGTARYEDLAALSVALTELDASQMLQGKALVRARLILAQRQADAASATGLDDLADQLLQEAQATGDASLIRDAYSLVGNVAQARNNLAAAQRAFTQSLAISERLATLDPTNTGWQRDLAIAHRRLGNVAQARNNLPAAADNIKAQPRREVAGHMDDPSGINLVERARGGDQYAWDELVERYAPLVWSICRRYQLGRIDIDHVGQTVWLLLFEEIGNLPVSATLPGWLATTTQRECIRVLLAARRYDLTSSPGHREVSPDQADAMIEREILAAEPHAALRAAYADLPDRCRQLLSMLLSDPPVPYVQISATLSIPVGSIGPQRMRCLERLRRSPHLSTFIDGQIAGNEAENARTRDAGGGWHA
jgi:RNA polymerase sigma factor (sigma-70 family)